MYEDQRPGQSRLAGEVRGFHANTMRVKDAKKAAKLQGGITQQSAEDATFRQGGVDVESARSAGLIPPVNNALVGAFANHKTLAPKKTIDTASRTLNARLGFPCDGVNREPHRKEAAGAQVGCSSLRVWNPVGSCKFTSALRCS